MISSVIQCNEIQCSYVPAHHTSTFAFVHILAASTLYLNRLKHFDVLYCVTVVASYRGIVEDFWMIYPYISIANISYGNEIC